MNGAVLHRNLPVLLGTIRQVRGSGELILEQNDGVRRFYFAKGELVYLRSEAAGEQFGNYLLRHGILDLSSLQDLLADEESQAIGEKVILSGRMSLQERNGHLQALQEQILIHALEHSILQGSWVEGAQARDSGRDLPFSLDHRQFLWRTLQEANYLANLLPLLEAERTWRWVGRRELLDHLDDLPLTPATAYAISFLGKEPLGFETFRFLSGFSEEDAGRFITTLWALGALTLEAGSLQLVVPPSGSTSALPLILPPPGQPFGPPKQPAALQAWNPLESDLQPEFIDLDADSDTAGDSGIDSDWTATSIPETFPADDLPPCGPRPTPPAAPRPEEPFLDTPAPRPSLEPPDPQEAPDPPALPQVDARRLLARARRQVKLGRTVEAVQTLEEAVDLQPDEETAYAAWLLLGRLRMVNPAWSTRALHALQNASLIRVREAEPWAAMGEIYQRRGSESEASTCFRKALELDPSVAIPPQGMLKERLDQPPLPPPPRQGFFARFRSPRRGKP